MEGIQKMRCSSLKNCAVFITKGKCFWVRPSPLLFGNFSHIIPFFSGRASLGDLLSNQSIKSVYFSFGSLADYLHRIVCMCA